MPQKGAKMTTAKSVIPFLQEDPENILFVTRTRNSRMHGHEAYLMRQKTGNNNVFLTIRKSLITELFPEETHFDFSRGLAPNHAWLKITPNKRGVKMTGALYFGVGSIVPPERLKKGESVEVEIHARTNALYIKLPEEFVGK